MAIVILVGILVLIVLVAVVIISLKDNREDVIIQRLHNVTVKDNRVIMAAPRIYGTGRKLGRGR